MAGQEGFEPPTSGFGDRRSTVGAIALQTGRGCLPEFQSPGFAMQCMLLVPGTIFFHLKTPGSGLLVFPGAVIAAFALRASHYYVYSHMLLDDLCYYA